MSDQDHRTIHDAMDAVRELGDDMISAGSGLCTRLRERLEEAAREGMPFDYAWEYALANAGSLSGWCGTGSGESPLDYARRIFCAAYTRRQDRDKGQAPLATPQAAKSVHSAIQAA